MKYTFRPQSELADDIDPGDMFNSTWTAAFTQAQDCVSEVAKDLRRGLITYRKDKAGDGWYYLDTKIPADIVMAAGGNHAE